MKHPSVFRLLKTSNEELFEESVLSQGRLKPPLHPMLKAQTCSKPLSWGFCLWYLLVAHLAELRHLQVSSFVVSKRLDLGLALLALDHAPPHASLPAAAHSDVYALPGAVRLGGFRVAQRAMDDPLQSARMRFGAHWGHLCARQALLWQLTSLLLRCREYPPNGSEGGLAQVRHVCFCLPFLFLIFLRLLLQKIQIFWEESLTRNISHWFLDAKVMDQGIYGLGGFLKASKELRILWSPPYFSRLWCIFVPWPTQ